MSRSPGLGSWPALGPGLAGLLVPPLIADFVDPELWRLIALGVVAVAVVVVGAVLRLQAPLVLNGATSAFGDWLFDFTTSAERPLSQSSQSYRALALPALIIWGDRDATTPLPQGERLKEVISGSELAIMQGVGHMPQIEDPPQFERLLVAFLQKQRRSIAPG